MKKFFKNNAKTIMQAVLVLAVAIFAYILAHKAGTAERGYEAVGGEIFIPLLIIFAKPLWEIIKAPFKAVKDNADS